MTDVTLVGAGALGQGLAALLARNGEVSLLARRAPAQQLLAVGSLTVRLPEGETQVALGSGSGKIRVLTDPEEIDPQAAVVLTPKGHNLPQAIDQLAARWAPTTGYVLGLQNGVAKDRLLIEAFGAERVLGAATVLGARREPDGVIRVTSYGQTYLGELDGALTDRLRDLSRRFTDAGLPCRSDLDIRRLLWTKCVNALGVFGVTCLTQLPTNVVMRSEPLVQVFVEILAEGAEVAAAEGYPVGDFPDLSIASWLALPVDDAVRQVTDRARATELTSFAYSSMAMDVILGRPTEVAAVFGDVIARAERHGLAVPRLRLVHDLVTGMDGVRELVPHRQVD